MRSTRLVICLAGLLAFATARACPEARAQSSLFTVPTGEVTPKGESYLSLELDTKPTSYESGGFQSYGVFFLHGAREGVEVGVNAYFLKDGTDSEPVELQSNIQFRFYQNKDAGVSAAAGAILYVPTGRRGVDTLAMAYASVSKNVAGLGGAQFTGGGYTLIGQRRDGGSRAGALFGYDQPLPGRLRFMADWNTGRNRFGYAAAGFGVSLSERSDLYSAYYFGNEGRGNNFLGVYYGRSF